MDEELSIVASDDGYVPIFHGNNRTPSTERRVEDPEPVPRVLKRLRVELGTDWNLQGPVPPIVSVV